MPETLTSVVARLDEIPESDGYEIAPTIFARRPFGSESDAVVLADEVVQGAAVSSPEFAYVLEVSIAKEVLEVWSAWRSGVNPSVHEAVLAIIHYAVNDAYLPTE